MQLAEANDALGVQNAFLKAIFQIETFDVVKELRELVARYEQACEKKRILGLESGCASRWKTEEIGRAHV